MRYYSILFDTAQNEITEDTGTMPESFADLNLDQIIREVLEGKEEYNLNTFFYQSLKDISSINYRLEVMREMEDDCLYNSMVEFSNEMKKVREFIGYSNDLHNPYQREKWHLDAVMRYCSAVMNLNKSLLSADLKSRGLRLFSIWLTEYVNSEDFKASFSDTNSLHNELNSIKYSVQMERGKLFVYPDNEGEDYCALINSTFERLNEVTFDYRISFFTDLEMCMLENRILEIVRRTNKESFSKLDTYYKKYTIFLDETIKRFDREIQFYLSYMNYIGRLKRKGMDFSYPEVSELKKIDISEGYDLALAFKNLGADINIVSNDFYLEEDERIYILTGPNQGGKTTYARAFGQILFLASIGCPVPCRKARVFLFDNIFTHFSVEENLSTNAGRLKEELFRLKHIMDQAAENSVIIINELFATTTTHDAYTMGKMILDYFISIDCFCLYVTHIHELAHISKKAVSLVAEINPDKGAVRTYKIFRKPADGHAYANSIVEKYNLTYSKVKERIRK